MTPEEHADKSFGPSQSEIIEMRNEAEREMSEPCETCERSHNPHEPCGTQFPEP